MDWKLYYQTIKYLKWKQIIYQIRHKTISIYSNNKKIQKAVSVYKKGYPLSLIKYIDKPVSLQKDDLFTFLNISCRFKDWNHTSDSMLWMYNLNYMDYLLQTGTDPKQGIKWINQFIKDQSTNKTGFDAYPISIRGVNWIKFISRYPMLITEKELEKWNSSLFTQYQYLYNNIEYHLLGNHLLENAFSLLWGGLYFRENLFYDKAVQLLKKELDEQILPDGAHYELSPMYHEILLDRLLDCVNALKNNIRFDGQKQIVSFLEEKAKLMSGWLSSIVYKDGTIPLMNDAAYKIAPASQELFAYMKRLGIQWSKQILKDSGYRTFCSDHFEMIFDVGDIGPDYIPGHAHADTFSYELRIDGKPFIIDTGISTYEKNSRRQYERETQAHNTVQVDYLSSSKVWGGFRVAERAKIGYLKEENNRITARHDGFRQIGIEHQRTFEMNDAEIIIIDSLLPSSDKKGINRIHLHPDIKILSVNQHYIQTDVAEFIFDGVDKLWIEECKVAFEYNKLIMTKRICMSFTDNMEYRII